MYIQLALIGDVDSLTEVGKSYLRQSMGSNWTDRPGNPETILIEGSGQIASELIDQASLVPPEALVAIGTTIYGVPIGSGTRAVGTATITFATGVPATTIPIDSELAVPSPSGGTLVFLLDSDVNAPVGGGVVSSPIVALDVGTDYNGAYGSSELIEVVEGVTSVNVATPTSDGTDPETSEDYLDRLTSLLTIPRRPVLPEDHSNLALQVPGVSRATAYNLYYPGTDARDAGTAIGDFSLWTPGAPPTAPQSNVARCTSVAIMGADGAAPTTQLMQDVYDVLNANREVNFMNFVVSPTYTQVDVQANIKPYSGVSPTDAVADATSIITEWLSPQSWSQPPGVDGGVWEADTKVRLYEVVDYLNRAPGVWYCENVQIKLHSDSTWHIADVTLPGLAPVPIAATITITAI